MDRLLVCPDRTHHRLRLSSRDIYRRGSADLLRINSLHTLSNAKLCLQAKNMAKANLYQKSLFASMSFFRRASITFYNAWILIEIFWFFAYGPTFGWPTYVEIEISLMYFVGFLLYFVLLHVSEHASFASRCLNGVMTGHQLLLISTSILKITVGSLHDRFWYGLRCLLLVMCVVPALGSTSMWIVCILGKANNNT